MRTLSIPMKVALAVYLFLVGGLAVNIHIQMLEGGVPHPRGLADIPSWNPFLQHWVQLMGIAWLYRLCKERFPSFGYGRSTLLLFAVMVTLLQLILRLPITAGYVNGRSFLFTWAVAYLPDAITLLFSTALVVLLASLKPNESIRRFVVPLGLLVGAILAWKVVGPVAAGFGGVVSGLFQTPRPEALIPFPYGQTVNRIASVLFIEPTVSCFIIGWLAWNKLSSNRWVWILQFNLLILMLVNRLVDQTIFMAYSTLPPMEAFLSMGQFTFQWIFIGVMIPLALGYLKRAPTPVGSVSAGDTEATAQAGPYED
jgi:hypothetical protein